jgi:hypothetical protein
MTMVSYGIYKVRCLNLIQSFWVKEEEKQCYEKVATHLSDNLLTNPILISKSEKGIYIYIYIYKQSWCGFQIQYNLISYSIKTNYLKLNRWLTKFVKVFGMQITPFYHLPNASRTKGRANHFLNFHVQE